MAMTLLANDHRDMGLQEPFRAQSPHTAGQSAEQMLMLMLDEAPSGHFAFAGLRIGASAGALLGAIVTLMAAAATTLTFPVLGNLTTDPVTAALLGAAAGTANGALVGTLIGWSIPMET